MLRVPSSRAGFSLIELFIAIAVMGILAGMVVTYLQPSTVDQLQGAAQVLTADLGYARSLAVSNDSTYRVTFDRPGNRYVLEHSGTNTVLDALPASPFRRPGDPVDQEITDLDELPQVRSPVRIATVRAQSTLPEEVKDVEFGPLGETTRATETVVWLVTGSGDQRRFLTVHLNPVTGLASLGSFGASPPPRIVAAAASSY